MIKKKILIGLLLLSLIFSCFLIPMRAADTLRVSAGDVSVAQGNVAEVAVTVSGNPGLRALGLDISFDPDALSLENVEDAGLFAGFMFSKNVSDGSCRVSFVGSEPSDKNGTILNLKFKVTAAEGEYKIGVTVTQAATMDENGARNIAATTQAGSIRINGNNGPTEDPIAISVGDAQARKGDTVEIPVAISGNPGLRALGLDISFDADALSLEAVENAELFNGFMFSKNVSGGSCRVSFVGSEPSDKNGTVLNLKFKVTAAEGEYKIGVTVTQAATMDENGARNISATTQAGMIRINGNNGPTEDPIAISVGDAQARKGDTVEIPVAISGNPGLRALGLDISFDADALSLEAVENTELFNGFMFSENVSDGSCRVSFVGSEPSDKNGTVLNLKFKATAAEGEYKIGVTVTQAATMDENGARNIAATTQAGMIRINGNSWQTEPKTTEPKTTEPKTTDPKPTEPKPTDPKPTDPVGYKLGDVNMDGRINSQDACLALRAAARLEALSDLQLLLADLNGDGKLNAGDARLILRIAAKLDPEPEHTIPSGK